MSFSNRQITLLAIVAVVLVVIVFSSEGILTLLRVRNISASLVGIAETPVATAQAGATPAPSALTVAANQPIGVSVKWDYEIGPRFPDTQIHLEALDQNNTVVAANDYTITCGDATLNCSGTQVLSLRFGVIRSADSNKPAVNWPQGSYTLRGTWVYAGLTKFHDLIIKDFVIPANG